MATGGGHAPLTESMAVKSMPVMTKKAFVVAEKQIDQWWSTLLEDSMKEAGAAKKAIAYFGNNIMVYLGDNIMVQIMFQQSLCYNTKSGVAIIIGLEMKKMMYLGVRNKYCSICTKAVDGKLSLHQSSATGMNLHPLWRPT